MQGDFSRTTFDPLKHYSAVLAQQGRVQLDADFNEQAAILLRQLRTVVADLVGPARAPADGGGFEITQVTTDGTTTPVREDLAISRGRIYVDGLLVENDLPGATYWTQPDLRLEPDADELPAEGAFVVYLRVWERLVTALQDPAIREIALGDPGPDTSARAKTVWQVAALAVAATEVGAAEQEFAEKLVGFRPTGLLTAQAKRPPSAAEDACHLPPDNLFRGHENQLYRVEVHTGGQAWWANGSTDTARRSAVLSGATFKWSRENASVVFPVVSLSGAVATLGSLGRDGKLSLEVGDRVELVDDATAGRVADDVAAAEYPVAASRLRTVVAIDAADLRVTLDSQEGDDECGLGANPFLRRWDHLPGPGTPDIAEDGALPLIEGRWHELEDGVQVSFGGPPPSGGEDDGVAGTYRRGDYWLIPARTANGDVLWPKNEFRPPNGVEYHYAPLAYVTGDTVDATLRKTFVPLTEGSAPVREEPKPKTTSGRRKPTG
jgi:hypothetical protein